jgi:hypothetical protein
MAPLFEEVTVTLVAPASAAVRYQRDSIPSDPASTQLPFRLSATCGVDSVRTIATRRSPPNTGCWYPTERAASDPSAATPCTYRGPAAEAGRLPASTALAVNATAISAIPVDTRSVRKVFTPVVGATACSTSDRVPLGHAFRLRALQPADLRFRPSRWTDASPHPLSISGMQRNDGVGGWEHPGDLTLGAAFV